MYRWHVSVGTPASRELRDEKRNGTTVRCAHVLLERRRLSGPSVLSAGSDWHWAGLLLCSKACPCPPSICMRAAKCAYCSTMLACCAHVKPQRRTPKKRDSTVLASAKTMARAVADTKYVKDLVARTRRVAQQGSEPKFPAQLLSDVRSTLKATRDTNVAYEPVDCAALSAAWPDGPRWPARPLNPGATSQFARPKADQHAGYALFPPLKAPKW